MMPGSLCFQHVDDLSQLLTHLDETELYHLAVRIGLMVANGVQDLELTLSDKSALLPGGSALAQKVIKELRRRGVPIRAAYAEADLGGGMTGGARREAATLDRRISSGTSVAGRVRTLAQVDGRAMRLATTSMAPRQAYGHEGMGASPTQVSKMRSNYRKCTPLAPTRACVGLRLNGSSGRRWTLP